MGQQAIKLDVIKVEDFISASVILKRMDNSQIFSIDISLGDVDFMPLERKVSKEEIASLFLNKIDVKDINDLYEDIDSSYKFDSELDEIIFNPGKELNQIHKISDFVKENKVVVHDLLIVIYVVPLGTVLEENVSYLKHFTF